MKMNIKTWSVVLVGMLLSMVLFAVGVQAVEKAALPLIVYGDAMQKANYIPSGYMGKVDAISMDDKCTVKPQEGANCLKVSYNNAAEWGGVVWQSPANDWGEKAGGYDLTGATKLTFWARGEKGGEKVKIEAGILGKDAKFPDSDKISAGEIVLTTEWKQYTVDLTGKDLSCIKTGFCWVVGGQGQPITFYLDAIKYE